MANSIQNGIINYNGTKYKIIGETDTYYIGFAVKSLRSVLCRINKDLTGWKSKSIAEIIDLTKAIINSDGSIVAIGNRSRTEVIDFDCPRSSRTYNEAIICKYKSDLSIIDPNVCEYPFLVYNESCGSYSDIYFKDIIQTDTDSYIVIGHGIDIDDQSKIVDIIGRYDNGNSVNIISISNVVNVSLSETTVFEAKSIADSIFVSGDNAVVMSRLENITNLGKTHLHGIKITSRSKNVVIGLNDLCQAIFGAKLVSYCHDDKSIFIIGDYQKTAKSDNGSVVIHSTIQTKLYKIDIDTLSIESVIFTEHYDTISVDGDKVIVDVANRDVDSNYPNKLELTKDLILYNAL